MLIRQLEEKDVESYWNLRLEALQQDETAFAQSYGEASTLKDPIQSVKKIFKLKMLLHLVHGKKVNLLEMLL